MIYQGDTRDVLPTLDAGSVQCVVTSPPFYQLRDYGTATWEGGDPTCDHKVGRFTKPVSAKQLSNAGSGDCQAVGVCPHCGAQRIDAQIGLEPTPDAYITTLVAVFREVRRVLRDDGTVWLNLGDSFMDKQLQQIPARVALALQADGWYLRSDIIWAKGLSFCPSYAGSVMPESCTDRPTSAYEHVFLITKQPRYYYDAEAVREKGAGRDWSTSGGNMMGKGRYKGTVSGVAAHHEIDRTGHESASGRNLRNVWAINPQPFREAHFATFPMALVEPCIKAGSSQKGQCVACGAPWVRVVGSAAIKTTNSPAVGSKYLASDQAGSLSGSRAAYRAAGMEGPPPRQITGWSPSCECNAPTEPQTVLDPFAGSGTTGIVAARHGREFVGIELNPQYAQMAGESIDGPLFTEP
jgi:DNA modification methylase